MRREVDRRVLPSSIDFDVEFEPVTFLQITHSRTLNRTNVDERVGLSVIASDEAEAFHRVEELDRTGSLFAGQLTLRGFGALFDGDHIANDLQIGRRNFSAAINQVKFQLLTFGQSFKASAFDCADVNEHVFTAAFLLDEAEALLAVEEFHNALASANDLRRHPAAIAATTTAAARAAEAAATAAAEAAAAIAAAEAAASATTAAVTAATTAAAAITAAITAAETAATTEAITTAAAAAERIEVIFAETVTLIAAPAATSSIKTHKTERTLRFAQSNHPAARTKRGGQQHRWHNDTFCSERWITHLRHYGESNHAAALAHESV